MYNPSRITRAMLAVILLAVSSATCGGDEPAETERQTFAFTGAVERVDTVAKTVSVLNDDVPGWMGPMSMIYQVDPPEVLMQLQPGDRVRATVYAGDVTTLYAVERVQP
jgi:Cu/Ag efflux protein CusF